MAIETSHGKARPTLPRSKDLGEVETVGEPSGERGAAGRFASGNQVAVGRGWKHAIAKSLGRDASEGEAATVSKDAWRVYLAVLREMPHTGALVRTNVARHAREFAVAAFYDIRATEAGLATETGMLLADKAASHGARSERHAVTALDIATKLGKATRRRRGVPVGFELVEGGKP